MEIASAALSFKPTKVTAAYPAGSWSVALEHTSRGVKLAQLTGSGVYRVAVIE